MIEQHTKRAFKIWWEKSVWKTAVGVALGLFLYNFSIATIGYMLYS